MIVVSDTSPLNYLILVGAADVLPALFQAVLIPREVLRELGDSRAPLVVRKWAANPPTWLEIDEPVARLVSTAKLDRGEADAISLAKERGIVDLLVDEWAGRKVAIAEGLSALPTLAVLERAAEAGLLDFVAAIESLRRTTYRISPALLDAALARDAARKAREL